MISLVVIAKNSEKTIMKCVDSAKDICDEIIVILDSTSSDNTYKLLKERKINVISRKFINFSDQKNFGNSISKNDWVLSLDSDEYLSDDLNKEIKNLSLNKSISAYSMPRQNIFFNKPIYYTNWGKEDDRKVRLFNKQACKWVGEVHEELKVSGVISKLRGDIIHEPYQNVTDFIEKMNLYTSTESKFTIPIIDFLRRYILHYGFRDGVLGLFMSYLMVIYHTSIWVKLWLKRK